MKFGADYDDVLANTRKLKSIVAKEKYGIDIPYQFFRRQYVVHEQKLLTLQQYDNVKAHVYWHGRDMRRLRPVPGAIATIERLQALGHQGVIISSRSHKAVKVARKWCKRNGIRLEVIGVGKNNPDKSEVAKRCKLDAFVDNDLHKLEYLKGVVPHLFWFAPERTDIAAADGIATPVRNWDDCFNKLIALT